LSCSTKNNLALDEGGRQDSAEWAEVADFNHAQDEDELSLDARRLSGTIQDSGKPEPVQGSKFGVPEPKKQIALREQRGFLTL